MGFYATGFISVASESEAAFKAVALVEAEVKELHRKETPFSISVEKIGETANQPDSGKGFSWCLEEH
jgi:hypothetical protein